MRNVPRAVLWILIVIALFALNGCRWFGGGGGGDTAQVRLINAVPDADDLRVAVDGRLVWKHSLFRSNTNYHKIPTGTYDVRMETQDEQPIVEHAPLAFERGKAYTVLALGTARDLSYPPRLHVLEDIDPEAVPSGKARIRFIQAAPSLTRCDVLINNIVAWKRVGFGGRSQALLLDGGAYDIKVNLAGYVGSAVGPVSVSLAPGRAYTLVVMGDSARALTLEAYPDN